MTLTLHVLRAFSGVKVEDVDGALGKATGEVVTSVGESDVAAAFEVLEGVELFDGVGENVHHDDLVGVCNDYMEARWMERHSIHLFPNLRLHLDLQGSRRIIPNLNEPFTTRNDQLLPHADVHASDRAFMELLMDILKVSFFHVGPIKCHVHFHQLVSYRCKEEGVFGLANRHGANTIQHQIRVLLLISPYLIMHDRVRVHITHISFISPYEPLFPRHDYSPVKRENTVKLIPPR